MIVPAFACDNPDLPASGCDNPDLRVHAPSRRSVSDHMLLSMPAAPQRMCDRPSASEHGHVAEDRAHLRRMGAPPAASAAELRIRRCLTRFCSVRSTSRLFEVWDLGGHSAWAYAAQGSRRRACWRVNRCMPARSSVFTCRKLLVPRVPCVRHRTCSKEAHDGVGPIFGVVAAPLLEGGHRLAGNVTRQGFVQGFSSHTFADLSIGLPPPPQRKSTLSAINGVKVAETYALQASVEESMRVHATITDMQGKLNLRNWEATSAASLQRVWLVDCQSLSDHLMNPASGQIACACMPLSKRARVDLHMGHGVPGRGGGSGRSGTSPSDPPEARHACKTHLGGGR